MYVRLYRCFTSVLGIDMMNLFKSDIDVCNFAIHKLIIILAVFL
jgi:hypothetical protein